MTASQAVDMVDVVVNVIVTDDVLLSVTEADIPAGHVILLWSTDTV